MSPAGNVVHVNNYINAHVSSHPIIYDAGRKKGWMGISSAASAEHNLSAVLGTSHLAGAAPTALRT